MVRPNVGIFNLPNFQMHAVLYNELQEDILIQIEEIAIQSYLVNA
jgi:hypothetical protein